VLKFGDVVSDTPAPIIPYADCRVTCPHTRKQKNCGKQTRYELHVAPWFEQTDLIVSRDARNRKSLVRVRGFI
jgi:hypothetical protein